VVAELYAGVKGDAPKSPEETARGDGGPGPVPAEPFRTPSGQKTANSKIEIKP